MGYTHYWETQSTAPWEAWAAACGDIRTLLRKTPGLVQFELDDPAPAQVDAHGIRFNGIGDQGYETFGVVNGPQDDFCKTERKPYDLLVTACLLVLKAHLPGWITVRSDGAYAGNLPAGEWAWSPAEALCRKVLKYDDASFTAAKADFEKQRAERAVREAQEKAQREAQTGPWEVVLLARGWYIACPGKRSKFVGPTQLRGVNYRDKAQALAEARNAYIRSKG